MGLSDRDYMRERLRRTIERERANEVILTWPPKPWMSVTAVVVLAVLVLVYMY